MAQAVSGKLPASQVPVGFASTSYHGWFSVQSSLYIYKVYLYQYVHGTSVQFCCTYFDCFTYMHGTYKYGPCMYVHLCTRYKHVYTSCNICTMYMYHVHLGMSQYKSGMYIHVHSMYGFSWWHTLTFDHDVLRLPWLVGSGLCTMHIMTHLYTWI